MTVTFMLIAAVSPGVAATRSRVVGYDVARCLAILSMVFVNFEVVLAMGASKPAWLLAIASAFTGNASALFVTLAGVGIVLLGRRDVILKRALLLLFVGYAWSLLWSGDILHYYAFYLAIGVLCLGLSARWLWFGAGLSIVGFVALFELCDYGAGWQWFRLEYSNFWTLGGQARNLIFNGWHPLLPWLGFLFTGMALAKGRIHEPRRRRVALVASVVVYGTAWIASHYLTQLEDTRSLGLQVSQWFAAPEHFWGMSSLPPGPLYMLSAGAVAVFVIALCLELTARPAVAKLVQTLVITGQLALTFYLVHVLVLFFLVEPLAAESDLLPLELSAWTALGFGVFAIVFANVWRRFFARGPLEWGMRKLCG
ncbi:MAG: hypothetical protein ACI85K_003716 [Hyphomicrobiaceae bacterium]|jgi:uncharacterized protein